jgi:hypothetical protein
VAGAVVGLCLEHIGMQLSYPIEYLRLDVVHLGEIRQLEVQLLHFGVVFAHPLHRTGEARNRRTYVGLLEIAEHFVPVAHRGCLVQRRIEEGAEVVLLAPGDDRLERLIEVQIDEEVGLRELGDAGARLPLLEQDAVESRAPGLQRAQVLRRSICRRGRPRFGQVRRRH